MNLRTRLTLAGGGAVFAALAIASPVIYFNVRSKLHDQIDVSLIQTAQNVATKRVAAGPKFGGKLPAGRYSKSNNPGFPAGPFLSSDASGYFQLIPSFRAVMKKVAAGQAGKSSPLPVSTATTGATTPTTPKAKQPSPKTKQPLPNPKLPPRKVPPAAAVLTLNSFVPLIAEDALVASGSIPPYFRDVIYQGTAMRLYTMRLASSGDGLVRTARPLTEANATIARVRWLLIGLTLGGAVAAALLGRLAAAAVLRPVRSLAGTVQQVAATRDLNQRIPVAGRDELSSLAENFNAMLGALEESQRAQQQLIADASHELRTPLTAHRANVELLARPDLPAQRRPHVLGAAVRGIDELSTLISDLIQAARNGRSLDARAPVALDRLVATAIERAKHRAPGLQFASRLEPYALTGASTRMERAVDNVLDNAIKWSPTGGTVEITLTDGLVSVRDHGPGIDAADLPHVFDRFYRAAAARGLPGSGLGLAIVKQTVDDHGGSVTVAKADGGGTAVSFRFDAPPA
jgi:two-component system, OmpR family, sensor histidine kinase MprB